MCVRTASPSARHSFVSDARAFEFECSFGSDLSPRRPLVCAPDFIELRWAISSRNIRVKWKKAGKFMLAPASTKSRRGEKKRSRANSRHYVTRANRPTDRQRQTHLTFPVTVLDPRASVSLSPPLFSSNLSR